MAANERKKILFVASECVPFIKTGGLADVVGSLPKDIDPKDIDPEYYDVRVMIPKYSCMKQEVKDQMEYVTHFYMDYHWKSEYVGVLKTVKNGITFYFIDNEGFFTTDKPYTDDPLFEITRFNQDCHDDPQPEVPGQVECEGCRGYHRTFRLLLHSRQT